MHEGSINSKYIERSLCNFSSRDPREWDRFLKKCIWEFSNCEPAKYMLISTIFEYFCFAFFFSLQIFKVKMFFKTCAQLCLTHCDLKDCSPPGSSVHGIFQARVLEWVAISSSRGSSWPRIEPYVLHLLHWQVGSLPLNHLGSPF